MPTRSNTTGTTTFLIGNPPYDRDASAQGGFVLDRTENGRSLFDDILDDAKQNVIFSHTKSLNDLYVYFWRWAIWKVFEVNTGPAVVSMITSSSWLTGAGFLGLRRLVREVADQITIIDLGGAGRGARKEENVFDIQTPVAIVTLTRKGGSDRSVPAAARYLRVSGSRQEKLSALQEQAAGTAQATWTPLHSDWYAPLSPPAGDEDWQTYVAVADLLPWQQPGCSWGRTFPIAPQAEVLEERWRRFVSTADVKDREGLYAAANSGRNVHTKVGGQIPLANEPTGASGLPLVRYGYRSFDRQWAFSDPRFATLERPSLWWSVSPKQVFLTSMMTNPLGHGPAATVTAFVPDFHHFCGRGGKDVIALYRDAAGTPNVDPAALRLLGNKLGLTITVEQLFAYTFGVLAGADYTERFHEALETPGPRVPLTADPELFRRMVAHGEELIWLQTFGERFREGELPTAGITWNPKPSRLPEAKTDIKYDSATAALRVADGVLTGVPEQAWAFAVSGMGVMPKWLGYRMAKPTGKAASSKSSLDKIRPTTWSSEWSTELVEIVAAIKETVALVPAGIALLDEIVTGPLVAADELPPVPDALRQPPKAAKVAAGQEGFTFDDGMLPGTHEGGLF
ncbi:type ISP restriction/modification enzyme [Pedococcus bigeumensis]|uniref:type ISP restriction/modification enzyme n=1 Tax=Pedococcus bigeumensis TaxID=433644 RepID=UPI0011263156|nr:type ISP restriction/modification enzyme [Pedococcus bigeumensis]